MHGTINKVKTRSKMLTEVGHEQCDPHRREENEQRANAQIAAPHRLVMRFLPFIFLEDQALEPVELMEAVAERLMVEATKAKMQRKYIRILMEEEAAAFVQ